LEQLRDGLAAAIATALAGVGAPGARVTLEVPPRRQLGDLAWAGALPLAKALKRPPRAIAEEVARAIGERIAAAEPGEPLALLEPVATVEGPGFLNFRLRRGPALAALLTVQEELWGRRSAPAARAERVQHKVIVVDPNISGRTWRRIGHLRNAVLGDTLVRCLRFAGHAVEVQNYLDDTGVQVADVVVGFVHLPEDELLAAAAPVWPEVARGDGTPRGCVLAALAARRAAGTLVSAVLGTADFDDLCWDLYPRVTARYEADPPFAAHRADVLHAIEGGFPADLSLEQAVEILASPVPGPRSPVPGALGRLAAAVAEANLRCHLLTMGRLAVAYDVLPHESDILQRGFWQRAFELLREAGAVRLDDEGKNAGCWVMSLADTPEFAGMADADKILVRSNGTVTYTGKDIAYQLWKLGLLRDPDGRLHDFGYRTFDRFAQAAAAAPVDYGAGDRVLFRTTSNPAEHPGNVAFGAGSRVFNVIDVRQSYPQKVVKEAIRVLGHHDAADNSVHFAYEMVALTPAAVRRLEESLGISFGLTAEDLAKPFIEMSGRRGIGVKADALLATLVAEAGKAVAARQDAGAALPSAELEARARAIAVGALRYQMARQGRNRVLAFDFDEALAFEVTRPYLQYSAVRAHKIFREAGRQGLAGTAEADAASARAASVPTTFWDLALACARTREMAEKAVASLEFSLLAGHARDLAQAFHRLYHEHPVLHAEDEATRSLRRAVFRLYSRTITEILEELLGIPVPSEM
jgi:arginyl-tRNA synthetase